jgi:hypothetical protein
MLMLTREQAEAIAVQAAEYPQHDEAAKAKLRAAAGRKHEREAEDFRAFAAVDQAAYAGRIAASVARAAAGLEAEQAAAAEAEDKAAEALRAERAAQDRAREHDEHARRLQEAWKRTQCRGTPREQTDALKDTQAAAQVAQGERAAAEGKAAVRVQADRELEAARSRVTAAEEALQAARDLAASPGRAFYSPETCAENVTHLLRIWDTLQPVEQQLVKNTIARFAMITGLYDEIKVKGAAEREAELEGQRPQPGAFTLPGMAAGVAGR